jgi:hypothetical protein
MVPGTGVSYEESRGWISTDKYRFVTRSVGANETLIEAYPLNDSLAGLLGISRLAIRVDPRRQVVLGVVTYDPSGTLARTYEVTAFTTVDGHWYPARVETDHPLQRVSTRIV